MTHIATSSFVLRSPPFGSIHSLIQLSDDPRHRPPSPPPPSPSWPPRRCSLRRSSPSAPSSASSTSSSSFAPAPTDRGPRDPLFLVAFGAPNVALSPSVFFVVKLVLLEFFYCAQFTYSSSYIGGGLFVANSRPGFGCFAHPPYTRAMLWSPRRIICVVRPIGFFM